MNRDDELVDAVYDGALPYKREGRVYVAFFDRGTWLVQELGTDDVHEVKGQRCSCGQRCPHLLCILFGSEREQPNSSLPEVQSI